MLMQQKMMSNLHMNHPWEKMHFQNWGKSFSKPDRIPSQNQKSKLKEGYWSEPPRCEPSGLLLASAIVVHGARHRRILRKGIQACFAIARNQKTLILAWRQRIPIHSFSFLLLSYRLTFFLLIAYFFSFHVTFSVFLLLFWFVDFFHSRAAWLQRR